jgi:IS605 OrfB family transposase
MVIVVKLVVQVKLLPSPAQAAALAATLHACNEAADYASRVAFDRKAFSRNDVQKLVYGDLKSAGLGAQAAVRTVKKVVDTYSTLRANLRAGNLTAKGRVKAESKPVRFRSEAAQPFDDRMLSWQHDAGTVSIWTVAGRLKHVGFAGHPDHLKTLTQHRQGETDLVLRDGKWLLLATCEIPDPEVFEPVDWIGVDRGIVNLATTSDGLNFQGRRLSRYRRWQARKRTARGIALENLDGIRERVRPRRDQRATHSSWPFRQLGQIISYKARRAGVPVIEVDARYTSQMCPRCGHTARNNRSTRDRFSCRRCGLAGPADHVAGINVRRRARSAWVLVNMPQLESS